MCSVERKKSSDRKFNETEKTTENDSGRNARKGSWRETEFTLWLV